MKFPMEALQAIQYSGLALAEKKNHDYSSAVDVIGTTGVPGLGVRLFDKASRLLSLTSGVQQQVSDESIRDTAMDLMNYATFLVAVLDGTWNPKP